MKKIIFSLLALCAVAFTSCGGVSVAIDSVSYMEMLKDGKFVEYVDNFTPALNQAQKDQFVAAMEYTVDENGAIVDYVPQDGSGMISEEVYQVIYTVTYESGESVDFPMFLKKADGDWKMCMGE